MTKNYFSHDYNTASDPKIGALLAEFGGLGYGIFWRIIEMLHIEESHKIQKKKYLFSTLAQQMSTTVEQISTVLNYCAEECELLSQDDNFFWSERVFRNIEVMRETSKNASKAGKASAEARRRLTLVNDSSTHVNKTKENKTNLDHSSFDHSDNLNKGDLNNIVGAKKNLRLATDFDDSLFEKFWLAYHPAGKVSRKKTLAIWRREKLDSHIQEILAHIEKLKETQNWLNGEFIPHSTTYLNQERWTMPVIENKFKAAERPLTQYQQSKKVANEAFKRDFEKIFGSNMTTSTTEKDTHGKATEDLDRDFVFKIKDDFS